MSPSTEAGRRLLGFIDAAIKNTSNGVSWRNGAGYTRVCAENSIPAIEAEARAALLAELEAEVAGLPQVTYSHPMDDAVYRAAVLDLFDRKRKARP